jgi:hypothetical protein
MALLVSTQTREPSGSTSLSPHTSSQAPSFFERRSIPLGRWNISFTAPFLVRTEILMTAFSMKAEAPAYPERLPAAAP